MTVRLGTKLIANTGGSGTGGTNVLVDNTTIVKNSSDVITTVAVDNKNNKSDISAVKTWMGTLAEYEAIAEKSEDIIYYITDDETLAQSSNIDLSNLSEVGQAKFDVKANILDLETKANKTDVLNKSQITNCLLEVPQNIKLELVDGVLTLKAGSKVIVPNGAGVFDEVEITSDVALGKIGTYTGISFFAYKRSTNVLVQCLVSTARSGATDTNAGTNGFWYDTANNTISNYYNGGTNVEHDLSLPFAIVHRTSGSWDKIEQIFNGIGYIGSTVWVDKGVKGLIPNGRNEDGTLKNIEFTVEKIRTLQCTHTGTQHLRINGASTQIGDLVYLEDKNWNTRDEQYRGYMVAGTVTATSGVISNLDIKLPFRAVDYNDFQNTPHIVSTYVNGTSWYRVWSDGWIEQGGYYTHNNTATVITVTLLKSFSNTNYNLQKLNKSGSSAASSIAEYGYVAYETKNTGSFTCKMTASNRYAGFDWYACGY